MEHMAHILLLLGTVDLHLRLDALHAQKKIQRMRHPKQEVIGGAGHKGRGKVFRNVLSCGISVRIRYDTGISMCYARYD